MLSRTLAAIAAALPSSLKYRIQWLRPLYSSALSWGEPLVEIQTAAGSLHWRVDSFTSQSHILGNYEPAMQRAFLKFVRSGAVVYDAGAHAGFHSLFCALLAGSSGRVFAFEPDPRCRQSLQRQIEANPHLCVTVLPYALSDRCTQLPFTGSVGNGKSQVMQGGDLLVEAATIDRLVGEGQIPPPDVIKIDVEGHEAALLRGGTNTFARYRPVILCDYNDSNTFEAVSNILIPLGYKVDPGPPVIGTATNHVDSLQAIGSACQPT